MRRHERWGVGLGALLAVLGFLAAPDTGGPVPAPVPRAVPASGAPLPVAAAVPVESASATPAPAVPAVDPIASAEVPRFAPAEAPVGRLQGHVVGADGLPLAGVQVMVQSEDGSLFAVPTDAEGAYRLLVPPGRLQVHASRWDALVEVRSEAAHVRLTEGAVREVPLELQAEVGADAGLVAIEHPDGFEVTWAVPGLAAHELGLGAGDRIVAVAGRPATELTGDELERLLVGTEGTELALTVVVDGERTELAVPRWGLAPEHMAAAEAVTDSGPG